MAEKPFLYEDLAYQIIGAAMEVHKLLGPGFVESVYEMALAHECRLRSIPFRRQADLTVAYKGLVAGEFRADFVVDDAVIVELKAVSQLGPIHEAQLINYLKATPYRVGLLLNFGASSLQYKRRIC